MKMKQSLFGLVGLFGLYFLAPMHTALAAPCTDGVNCYCDRVRGGDLNDSNLLYCEDFEAPTLHDDTSVGGGGPTYGPWYDDSGFQNARGANSYWTKTYGSVVGTCAWHSGQPSSPTVGRACAFGTCFAGEWRADDRWQANSFACIDIVRTGEFGDEVSSLSDPVIPGGGVGAFDGLQSLGHRIGAGKTAGILGEAGWQASNEIGLTMALAYPQNVFTSGVTSYPWKHDEFRGTDVYIEHWNLGLTGVGGNGVFPYSPFMFNTSQGACNSALTNATLLVGRADCTDVALRMGADPNVYQQSRDFPLGTWGCHQAHISGMGTSNVTIKIWHNETLIFHLTGFNGSALQSKSYRGFAVNAYSNANQGFGATPTSQTTYRYQDNMHIRRGAPVSCAQLGFPNGSGGDSTPPASPQNLQVN